MITMRFFIWVNFSILLSSFLGEKIMGQPRSSSFASSTLNVIEFGARGNDQSKDTQAVQAAIDSCAEKGGGTVYFFST